jgi:kynurenine formamidase
MPQINYSRIIELSHTLHRGIPLWPGDPPVEIRPEASIETDSYALRSFSMGEHSGTHLNAPAHFYPRGRTVDGIAPESLVLPAVVIDVRLQAALDEDFALNAAGLEAWEADNGRVPRGCLVILFTGWQERWDVPAAFINRGADGRLHFPGFGLDAARLLLDERGAAGLGSDAHSVEIGLDAAFSVNQYALARGALVLENLTNLEHIPTVGAILAIGLLRLEGASGAPAAVLAFVP